MRAIKKVYARIGTHLKIKVSKLVYINCMCKNLKNNAVKFLFIIYILVCAARKITEEKVIS